VDITKVFLLKKFREYYSRVDLYIPKEFERREWAFAPLENFPEFVMNRHIAFSSDLELKAYILTNIPAHAYYSSAYYEDPSAEMGKKGWMGADLIFDIDADHLPSKSLKSAKREVFKLVKILTDDFGVSENDIEIVFSGHRGYHIHVYDERFKELESAERREIVDYLTLNSLKAQGSRQMKRVARCIAKYIANVIKDGRIDAILEEFGVADVSILKKNIKSIADGDLSSIPKAMLDRIFNLCVLKVATHIDPPVTADIKRLIRLPNSLHGKTGLRVTVVPLDKLEEFDPLRDAVVFGDEKVKVRIKKKVKLRMKGEEFTLDAGKNKVPEYLAIFLICRGVAVYGH
jgi:DNA primase small subunit